MAQVVFVTTGAGAEYANLYDFVSRSALVVTGKVTGQKQIMQRGVDWGPGLAEEGGFRGKSVEDVATGRLLTFEFNEPLCRQQDFTTDAAPSEPIESPVQIFIPSYAKTSSDVFPGMSMAPEQMYPGKEYLVYLYRYPKQQELTAKYELDPKLTYYRAYDGYMGAYELPDAARKGSPRDKVTPLIATLTELCGAVKPADIQAKLSALRALRERAGPRWRDSVDAAVKELEAIQSRPK